MMHPSTSIIFLQRNLEYCLLCTAGRGTLDAEDVEDVEDVADVEDVKDVEDRTWRT